MVLPSFPAFWELLELDVNIVFNFSFQLRKKGDIFYVLFLILLIVKWINNLFDWCSAPILIGNIKHVCVFVVSALPAFEHNAMRKWISRLKPGYRCVARSHNLHLADTRWPFRVFLVSFTFEFIILALILFTQN